MNKLIRTLLFLFLLSGIVYGQASELSNPQPYFIALIVSDMDSSLVWYSDNLGFEILNRTENQDQGFKQSNIKRDNFHIELLELDTAIHPADILKEKPPRSRISGIFKFGFSVSDFDDWIAHLENAGVTFNGRVVTDPLSNKRTVIILDPDGNRVQVFEK